jgi:hypothetical protein
LVNSNKQNLEISLFPNPASKTINTYSENNDLILLKTEIYSVLGDLVLTDFSNRKISEKSNIDISRYKPGLYIAKIYTNRGVVCRKFSKQ